MDPLTPNDPLWKVLGRAKPVEPRPNFLQNVMREARQTPQERGWLARVRGWWSEMEGVPAGLAWSAAAALVLAGALLMYEPGAAPRTVAQTPQIPAAAEPALSEADFPLVPEFETEWNQMEQMGALLAVQDTSELTDTEIHLLLY